MVQDLAVLTPSLVVCAAFLAGVVILLRREMAPRRRNREGDGSSEDISAAARFPNPKMPRRRLHLTVKRRLIRRQ